MPFLQLIVTLLSIYSWIVIIGVILSWLMMYGVINGRNELVANINRFCMQATEPALRRIRQYIRPINGFDLSPIVLLLGIELLRNCIIYYGFRMVASHGL